MPHPGQRVAKVRQLDQIAARLAFAIVAVHHVYGDRGPGVDEVVEDVL
jgi:hypothetical protein